MPKKRVYMFGHVWHAHVHVCVCEGERERERVKDKRKDAKDELL